MAIKTWLGGIGTIGYDVGLNEPAVGDILTGAAGAFGTLVSCTLTSGAWGSTAAGVLTFRAISGTFVEDEVITNTTQSEAMGSIDIATTPLTDSSGDFDTAANWDASGVPAGGDTIYFNGLATTVPAPWDGSDKQTEGKKFSVDDGFDQSAKNFAAISISGEYDGNIGYGADGSVYYGLRCACDGAVFAGSGDCHLIAQHASLPIDAVSNSSSSGTLYLGKGYTNGQEFTKLTNSGSIVEVLTASGTTLAAPEVLEAICVTRRGSITIPEDNSGNIVITSVIGTVTAYCSIANAEVVGGTLRWGKDDFDPAAARTIANLQLSQGSFIWDMAGTILECVCHAGKFTLSGSGFKTIGNSAYNNGTIEVYNADVDWTGASNNISLGTNAEVKIFGDGSFVPPKFTEIVFTN